MLQSEAMKYAVARLKRNPSVKYAAVAEGAKAKRLRMYPIVFGRARAWLGLPKRKA